MVKIIIKEDVVVREVQQPVKPPTEPPPRIGLVEFSEVNPTELIPGPTGPQGARGSQWTTGDGPPVDTETARLGDQYLDDISGEVWAWDGEAWIDTGTNITGPQGSPDTPQQVLDKLLQVDGAGSGLDADLLDGQSGATYLALAGHTGTINDTQHGPRGGGALHTAATGATAGFLSAADKVKLDGIEAGAEVNQTAAELLTAIKTVDGPGSGLDADTLDGQSGSFYQSRPNHTGEQAIATVTGLQAALDGKAPLASPALTGNPTAPTPVQTDNDTSIATTAYVTTKVNAAPPGEAPSDGITYGRRNGAWVNTGVTPPTPQELLDQIKQVDGAGSGLDADLLDGYSSLALTGVQSPRDFTLGCLITTDLPSGNATPLVIEITGNSYGELLPFDVQVQGYWYPVSNTFLSTGAISNGADIGTIDLFVYNGVLCCWIPYGVYWQGITVKVFNVINGNAPALNRVVSVANAAKPGGVTGNVTVTPTKSAMQTAAGGLDLPGNIKGQWLTAKYVDDTHYGVIEAFNASGARGGYFGFGNGADKLNLTLDAASLLEILGGNVSIPAGTFTVVQPSATYAIDAKSAIYPIRGQSTAAAYGGVIGYSQDSTKYGILGHGNTYSFYGSGNLYVSGTGQFTGALTAGAITATSLDLGAGDATARLFRTEYATASECAYFVGMNALGAGADNYMRPMTIAQAAAALDASLVPVGRTVTAGNGLTGGGALSANVTVNVGAGTAITVAADTVSVDTTVWRDGNLPTGAQVGQALADLTAGALGAYALLRNDGYTSSISQGAGVAGSNLRYASASGGSLAVIPSGSWRAMGYSSASTDGNLAARTTLYLRYA